MANALFQLFRGTLDKIKNKTVMDGNVYLDTNSNCFYADHNNKHNPINAQGLYQNSFKLHPTVSYKVNFSEGSETTKEERRYSFLWSPSGPDLICGRENLKQEPIIPPVIVPCGVDTDYDYIESAEVINRNLLDPDNPFWMINFEIQLPEGRTEIEPFSVLVLDTQ